MADDVTEEEFREARACADAQISLAKSLVRGGRAVKSGRPNKSLHRTPAAPPPSPMSSKPLGPMTRAGAFDPKRAYRRHA